GTLPAEVVPPSTKVDTPATAKRDPSPVQPDQPTSSNPEVPKTIEFASDEIHTATRSHPMDIEAYGGDPREVEIEVVEAVLANRRSARGNISTQQVFVLQQVQ
ncbi:UNVERIFIED_CONTAM: hypothetical protein Sradi_2986000, partial [Sesamum radiatum]